MLESEPDRCYVCLEECETKSPCECQMPVHERCLSEAHHVSQRKNCSICHSAIQVKNLHLFPIPPTVFRRHPENQIAGTRNRSRVLSHFHLFGFWMGRQINCIWAWVPNGP